MQTWENLQKKMGAILSIATEQGYSQTKSPISIKISLYAIEGSIGILHSQWDMLQEHGRITRHGKKDECFERRNSTSAMFQFVIGILLLIN